MSWKYRLCVLTRLVASYTAPEGEKGEVLWGASDCRLVEENHEEEEARSGYLGTGRVLTATLLSPQPCTPPLVLADQAKTSELTHGLSVGVVLGCVYTHVV